MRIVLLVIFILTFANPSLALWQKMDTLQLEPKLPYIVWISDLFEPKAIKLEVGLSGSSVQDLGIDRGTGGVFFLYGQENPISVLMQQEEGEDYNGSVKTWVWQVDDEKLEKTLNRICVDLSSWQSLSEVGRKSLLAQVEDILDRLSPNHPVAQALTELYISLLKAIGDNIGVTEFWKRFKIKLGGVSNLSVITVLNIASSYQSLQLYDPALSVLKEKIDGRPKEDLPQFEEISYIDAEGTYGNLLLQTGYRSGIRSTQQLGKNILEESISKASYVGEVTLLASFQSNLATYFWVNQNYTTAERLLRSSINNYRSAGLDGESADPLNNLALLQLWTGRPNEALVSISEAIDLDIEFDDGRDSSSLGYNLARVYASLGLYDLGVIHSANASEAFRLEGNKYGAALADNLNGLLLRKSGRATEAIVPHNKSVAYFGKTLKEDNQNLTNYVSASVELSRTYLEVGDFKQADYLSDLLKVEIDNKAYSQKFIPELLRILMLRAELAVYKMDFEQFQEILVSADSLLSSVEGQQSHALERLEFFNLELSVLKSKESYGEMLLVANKARKLIDTIANSLEPVFIGPSWSIKASETLDYIALALTATISEDPSRENFEKLHQFLETTQGHFLHRSRVMVNSMRENDLGFAKDSPILKKIEIGEYLAIEETRGVGNDDALIDASESRRRLAVSNMKKLDRVGLQELISLNELQKLLKPEEIIIRYFLREQASFVFVVSSTSTDVIEIENIEKVAAYTSRLVEDLISQSLDAVSSSSKLAKELKLNILLSREPKKLIIVPDGPLHTLPLGALNVSANGLSYIPLEMKMETISVYSLSDFYSKMPGTTNVEYTADIAIFADPVFSDVDDKSLAIDTDQAELRSWVSSLKRLPWTLKEAKNIVNYFPNKIIKAALRSDATKSALLSEGMRKSRVLHIASHGYYNQAKPNIVGVFASRNAANDPASSFVSLTELLSSRFYSNLVVVSGCETALGAMQAGEGMNGFARGILSKGAENVIGTLWPIPDKATAKFMEVFYNALSKNGGDASNALSLAKRQFMSSGRYRHPYYWSGFVLYSSNYLALENVFGES